MSKICSFKAYALKLIYSLLFLFLTANAFATTYNWVGGTSTNWNTASNWSPAGVPASTDDVIIGVNAFTNQPTISSTTPGIRSLTFGTIGAITLTINTGFTLTVSQNITQMNNAFLGGSTTNIVGQTTAGVLGGSITCANFIVGDNTAPPTPSSLAVGTANMTGNTIVNLSIQNFTVSGSVTLNTTSASALLWLIIVSYTTTNVDNPILNLKDGNLYIFNTITTTNSNYANTSGFSNSTGSYASAVNLSQLIVNPSGNASGTNPTLMLAGANALNLATLGSFVDFNGGGSGTSTVYYDGGSQTIYDNTTANLDNSPQTYQNLAITGTGTETPSGGTLLVGNNLTSSSPNLVLATNNAAVSVGGSWTNSSNVTQGTGNITVAGAVTNNSGGALNLSAANLSIGGNYTNNIGGVYTQGTGTTFFTGTGAQALVDNSTTGTRFKNVTFNGGGTATMSAGTNDVNFSVSSTSTLTMSNNSVLNAGTLTSGGAAYLTLNSTASGSATVAPMTGTAAINGNVNVQRFITGGAGYRGYRLLSSPVYGSTDASGNKIYTINYIKNSSYVTGTTGTAGGFDKAGNPTLYLYRENLVPSNTTFISGNFRGVNTIGTAPNYSYLIDGDSGSFNIPAGNGFLFFFRGDNSVSTLANETSTTYVPTSTKATATGILNQGQVTVHDWYTPSSANVGYTVIGTGTGSATNFAVRGFNFVGNPYASSIDWEKYNTSTTTSGIYASNISNIIYELNPATNNYDTYQVGGTHTNKGSNIIASGQGFFVLAGAASAKLIFNESAKSSTLNTGLNLFMSTANNIAAVSNPGSHLRLQLAKDSINTDDIYIGFNAAAKTQYVFNEDAPYRGGNGQVNMASVSSDNMALAINMMPLPAKSDTIALKVYANADGVYQLNMTELEAIPQLFDVWLMDAYKKDSLDMRHNKTYAFNLAHADTSSYGFKRFSLVIRQNPALGVHLLAFTATKATGGAQTTWKTENEQNYTNFTLQRSSDNGITYDVTASVVSSGIGSYSFLDKNPPNAVDLYRLKLEDLNGAITYSNVISLNYGNGTGTVASAGNISLYPNPASSVINLSVNKSSVASPVLVAFSDLSTAPTIQTEQNIPTPSFTIKIVSITGSVMNTSTSSQMQWQNNVSKLMPGTYFVTVTNNADNSLVGKSKFVKL